MKHPEEEPNRRTIVGRFHHYASLGHGFIDPARAALADARWHRQGRPAPCYLSDERVTMWAEHNKHLPEGVDPEERILQVGIVVVTGVEALDLSHGAVRDQFEVADTDLVSDDLTACHFIAEWASSTGVEGILAPSAARAGGLTLAVFRPALPKLRVVEHEITYGRRV